MCFIFIQRLWCTCSLLHSKLYLVLIFINTCISTSTHQIHRAAGSARVYQYALQGATDCSRSRWRSECLLFFWVIISTLYLVVIVMFSVALTRAGVQHERLCELAQKKLGAFPPADGALELTPCGYTGAEVRALDDETPLAHVALAVEGCGWASADNLPLMVANTLVGAWDRGSGGSTHNASRLAAIMADTEAQKRAHSFMAFNTCYTDTGLWYTLRVQYLVVYSNSRESAF